MYKLLKILNEKALSSIRPDHIAYASKVLKEESFEVYSTSGDTIEVFVTGENVDRFIKTAARFTILNYVYDHNNFNV